MSEKPNPNPPAGQPENALAEVFEELIAGRLSRAEAWQQDSTPDLIRGCPPPDAWGRCTSSQTRPAEADAMLAHAAFCRECAALLNMMAAEATPEETAAAANMAAASRDWQRNLSQVLAATPHKAQVLPFQRRVARPGYWALVGMAASLLLAVGVAVWWQSYNSPERLLAEAYTHSRVFELRMNGAGFADVAAPTHLRGATPHQPKQLSAAHTRIERQLRKTPQDAHWLELEARADVMEENFDPAIVILDHLLASGPVTAGLLVDAATAYYERGVCTDRESDRATALDYLRHADELAPDNPVVLFNEALAMEDRGQAMNAVETWNRYLRFERDPRWLAEGRRRLQALEQRLDQLKAHPSRLDRSPAIVPPTSLL